MMLYMFHTLIYELLYDVRFILQICLHNKCAVAAILSSPLTQCTTNMLLMRPCI